MALIIHLKITHDMNIIKFTATDTQNKRIQYPHPHRGFLPIKKAQRTITMCITSSSTKDA